MKNPLKTLAIWSSIGVAACTPQQEKCDTAVDSGVPERESSLEVINLTGAPVSLRLGETESAVSVPPFETFKVVEKATSGLKDTLKTQVRLAAGDAGTLETPVDVASGEQLLLVLSATPDGVSATEVSQKTTKGKTFGESMAGGLQAAGASVQRGVDVSGDCLADVAGEIGARASVVLAADATSLPDCPGARSFVRPAEFSEALAFLVPVDGSLEVAWVRAPRDSASGLATGRRMHTPLMLTTPALPVVYVLNAHEDRLPTTVSLESLVLAADVPSGGLVRVAPTVVAQGASLVGSVMPGAGVVSAAVSSVSGLSTGTTTLTATCSSHSLCSPLGDGDVLIIASSKPATMRMGQKNVIARGRRDLKFGSLVNGEATGCVAVGAGDDACIMGPAISALANGSGGAAQASYAATGRLIPPATVGPDATGAPPRIPFMYAEGPRRFDFVLPGETVTNLASHGGFFVVGAGTAIDAAATDARSLFWVDSSTQPWALSTQRSP